MTSARGFESIRWGATAAGFAFLAACALRPLAAVDGLAIPDDGYICLELARNLGTGRGATFAGLATNGFQPLWVLVLAPLFAAAPRADPDAFVHAALLLGALCASLAFALVAGWFRDRPRPAAWIIPLAAFWFPSGAVVQNALNAMETGLALLAVTAVLTALRPLDGAPLGAMSWRRAAALGGLLGLGVLARMDVGLLAAGLGLAWLARALAARDRAQVGRLALATGVALAVTAPWWIWSQRATGSWFPVSGRAVRVCSLGTARTPDADFYLLMVDRAWLTWTRHYGATVQWVLAALAAVTLGLPAARRAWAAELRRRSGLAAVAFALALVAAYVGYFFAPWFFRRYFFPLQLALAWAFAGAAASLAGALPRARHAALAAAVLTVAALGANLANRLTWRMLTLDDARPWSYRNVGRWAAGHFPPGTVVGAGQTGALAYYAPALRVVNLDGVVSAPAYDALLRRDLLGYARGRGVRFTLGWHQDSAFFRANSRPGDRATLRKVLDVPTIRAWGYPWEVCALGPPAP